MQHSSPICRARSWRLRPPFALFAALVSLLLGCDANVNGAERNIEDTLEDVARTQSQGMKDAVATIHRVYVYLDEERVFGEAHPPDTQLVAVDVEIDMLNGGYDLDDIDIVDAGSNENYGSDPALFGVLPSGELADIDDSEVSASPRSIRVLLIYLLPKHVETVRLEYWGETLTRHATITQGRGPEAKARRVASVQAEMIPGAYLVLLKVENWPREGIPDLFFIRCTGTDTLTVRRFVEVDESVNVLDSERKLLPFVPQRSFLLEYTPRDACEPRIVSDYFRNYPVKPAKLPIPPETLTALGALPQNPL